VKRVSPVYDNIHFWEVFEKIADDTGTVNIADLKRDLIASGYFDAGSAHQEIKERIDNKALQKIDDNRVRYPVYSKKKGIENNSPANMSKSD
jgi:hypothetical protein